MSKIKLAIDAGHGADNRKKGQYDPGAIGGGLEEADIALAWALTLKAVCVEAGVEFFLTRDDDRDSNPVGQRDDKAERAGCTHFLSLHCNAGGGVGTETYFRDQRDMALARTVQACAVTALGSKSRGIKSEAQSQHPRLAVFDFDGPAALLEIGFIDNENDRYRMTSRANRLSFARRLIGELRAK